MSIDHDPRENPEAPLLRNLRSGFATLLVSVLVGWWLIYPDDRPSRTGGADAPLRIGYAIEPPYAFLDVHGQLRGESIDVLRYVLHQEHIDHVVWLHVEFADLLHELKYDRIDIVAAGMFATPERRREAHFSRPTARVRAAMLVRDSVDTSSQLKDLVRQPTHRVAVIDGSVEQTTLQAAGWPSDHIHAYSDADAAMDALEGERVDMLALSLPSLRWQVQQRMLADRYRIVELAEVPLGYPAFAVAQRDQKRVEQIDRVLNNYIGSPAHVQSVQSYGFEWSDVVWPLGAEASR